MNLLLLAALLVAAFLLLHYRRARALLDDWIGSQQLQLLHAHLALAPPLSMLLTTSKAQVVYRIRVYDPAQQRIRSGWLRLGGYWRGLADAEASTVRWDEAG